jgi:hypothetical protein
MQMRAEDPNAIYISRYYHFLVHALSSTDVELLSTVFGSTWQIFGSRLPRRSGLIGLYVKASRYVLFGQRRRDFLIGTKLAVVRVVTSLVTYAHDLDWDATSVRPESNSGLLKAISSILHDVVLDDGESHVVRCHALWSMAPIILAKMINELDFRCELEAIQKACLVYSSQDPQNHVATTALRILETIASFIATFPHSQKVEVVSVEIISWLRMCINKDLKMRQQASKSNPLDQLVASQFNCLLHWVLSLDSQILELPVGELVFDVVVQGITGGLNESDVSRVGRQFADVEEHVPFPRMDSVQQSATIVFEVLMHSVNHFVREWERCDANKELANDIWSNESLFLMVSSHAVLSVVPEMHPSGEPNFQIYVRDVAGLHRWAPELQYRRSAEAPSDSNCAAESRASPDTEPSSAHQSQSPSRTTKKLSRTEEMAQDIQRMAEETLIPKVCSPGAVDAQCILSQSAEKSPEGPPLGQEASAAVPRDASADAEIELLPWTEGGVAYTTDMIAKLQAWLHRTLGTHDRSQMKKMDQTEELSNDADVTAIAEELRSQHESLAAAYRSSHLRQMHIAPPLAELLPFPQKRASSRQFLSHLSLLSATHGRDLRMLPISPGVRGALAAIDRIPMSQQHCVSVWSPLSAEAPSPRDCKLKLTTCTDHYKSFDKFRDDLVSLRMIGGNQYSPLHDSSHLSCATFITFFEVTAADIQLMGSAPSNSAPNHHQVGIIWWPFTDEYMTSSTLAWPVTIVICPIEGQCFRISVLIAAPRARNVAQPNLTETPAFGPLLHGMVVHATMLVLLVRLTCVNADRYLKSSVKKEPTGAVERLNALYELSSKYGKLKHAHDVWDTLLTKEIISIHDTRDL